MSQQLPLNENEPPLVVDDLVVEYETREDDRLRALDGISFTVEENETLGLVGESGCGKSTAAKAVLGLLPRNGEVVSGEVRYRGVDLTELNKSERNEIRWANISMISQGAMNSLNPVHKISTQIIEAIQAHEDVSKAEARDRIRDLFELVGLNPDRMDEYPHQYSGGMKQRAYIAMALALDPDLVIADEPTTALDVIVQDQILKRISSLQDELGLSMILITHDISVVAETCDILNVMYAGKTMEYGDLKSIFQETYNPYTLGLKNAFPSLRGEKQELISIPGSPPDLTDLEAGCRFRERCPFATAECETAHPPLEEVETDHYSACYRHDDIEMLRTKAGEREVWEQIDNSPSAETGGVSDD